MNRKQNKPNRADFRMHLQEFMPRKIIRREFNSVASSPFSETNDFATK